VRDDDDSVLERLLMLSSQRATGIENVARGGNEGEDGGIRQDHGWLVKVVVCLGPPKGDLGRRAGVREWQPSMTCWVSRDCGTNCASNSPSDDFFLLAPARPSHRGSTHTHIRRHIYTLSDRHR
jgi:hypothetical protein